MSSLIGIVGVQRLCSAPNSWSVTVIPAWHLDIGEGSEVEPVGLLGSPGLQDGKDGYAIHARDAQPGNSRFTGQQVRIGWVSDAAFGRPVDPEIAAAVIAAAAHFDDMGCTVEAVTFPSLGSPFGTMATLVYGELVPLIEAHSAGREDQLHAVGAGMIAMPDPSLTDFATAHATVEALRAAFAGYFQKFDAERPCRLDRPPGCSAS